MQVRRVERSEKRDKPSFPPEPEPEVTYLGRRHVHPTVSHSPAWLVLSSVYVLTGRGDGRWDGWSLVTTRHDGECDQESDG